MIASPAKLVSGCLIILCLIGAAIYWLRRGPEFPGSTDSTSLSGEAGRDSLAKLARLEATERQTDETIWSKEILAQRYGQVFESLWDSILTATNKLQVLGAMRVGEVVLGDWSAARELPHGIELREPSGAGAMVASQAWPAFVAGFERSGWRLSQIEFRHNQFDTDASGQPRQSRFHFSMHLTNALETARAMVAGDLIVGWSPTNSATVAPFVQRIDASQLTIKTRRGEPPFRKILSEELAPSPGALTIDPLILYDLDHDGLSEIILPAKNLVYRRRDSGRYEAEELCRHLPGKLFTAVIADFDGDGTPDLLCAKPDGLWLFSGSATGTFDEPPRLVWQASAKLEDAMVLTCGDLDGDGDLDVFLAQYKVPTLGQVTRPHFYDARDGFPAYLLLNNGHGGFVDATAAAGLDAKRRRRTYSASFVDLDADGDLDLLVVSDFAGMDVYRNDGHAHFTDVTGEWIPEPHAFGMAHAVADFNGDGRLDIFMTGMTSPVADRLEHLGLWRPNKQEDRAMRSRMTFGNRLFMAKQESAFALTSFSDSIEVKR